MAGIVATAISIQMTGGQTAAANSFAGFVVAEQVTLITTPTGTNYVWAQSIPSGSAIARSKLSASSGASVTFTPDVAGLYSISCTVDSVTVYSLLMSVTDVAIATSTEAIRVQKKVDTAVTAPGAGVLALFVSNDLGALAQKDQAGNVVPLRPGIVGAQLGDASPTVNVSTGSIFVMPSNTMTASRTVTLGVTGAALGHIIEIVRDDATAFTLALVNGGPGAGTLVTLPASERHTVVCRFDGTNWALWERRKLA